MRKTDTINKSNLDYWLHTGFFHQMPFNVAIIDREFNIVEANESFENYFGDWRSKKCYAVYKRQENPCTSCPHQEIFDNGKPKVIDTVVIDKNGRPVHNVIHSAPLKKSTGGQIDYITEMSYAITETDRLQQEYNILFDRVPCYVTVIDEDFRIVRANESFRESFGDILGQYCYEVYKRRKTKCPNCPAVKTFKDGRIHHSKKTGIGKQGQEINYVVSTSPLRRGGGRVAHVIEISTDVTRMKKLEKYVLEAERLAAVGHTVAGLAHSIKNILMGLEGGKYIVSVGLKKNDKKMINQGWEMLERNFEKTTSLVKDFLSFSKGRLPVLKYVQPENLVKEIIDLYKDTAAQSGIALKMETMGKMKKAPLDPDGIHTCLTNLVSNAIDACLMADRRGNGVLIRVWENRKSLFFEVSDNGSGIDHEIKKKIFTTFFTTKGGEGTGLGLLTTRKIVQEHGGKIEVTSQKGEGARFIMEFPRNRLMMLYEEIKQEKSIHHKEQ